MLTLITTDQFYIFAWVGITVVCFLPVTVKHSPFNRRFGYFTAWTAFMLEAGGIAFLPRTGPFAWNGLLTWWSPLVLVGVWLFIMFRATFRCLRAQENDAADAKRQGAVSKPSTTKVA
jgi:hypothetical protein